MKTELVREGRETRPIPFTLILCVHIVIAAGCTSRLPMSTIYDGRMGNGRLGDFGEDSCADCPDVSGSKLSDYDGLPDMVVKFMRTGKRRFPSLVGVDNTYVVYLRDRSFDRSFGLYHGKRHGMCLATERHGLTVVNYEKGEPHGRTMYLRPDPDRDGFQLESMGECTGSQGHGMFLTYQNGPTIGSLYMADSHLQVHVNLRYGNVGMISASGVPMLDFGEDGRLLQAVPCNMEDGWEEVYYPKTGNLKTYARWCDSERNGTCFEWSAEGQLMQVTEYVHGQLKIVRQVTDENKAVMRELLRETCGRKAKKLIRVGK